MELLITDLTYMRNGVCIAGININTGKNIRPVLKFEHIQQQYVEDKSIVPCAIVKFNTYQREDIKKPHIEDVIFVPEDTKLIRFATQKEWENYLDQNSVNSLQEAFNNCIVGNKAVPPLSDCGSLAILKAQDIKVSFFDSDPDAVLPFKCRISFHCCGSYYHLPVTDLQFIDYCIERLDRGDSRQIIKADIEKVVNESQYIYLRIGLTRPFRKSVDADELCYMQINGIYAEILDGMIRMFERDSLDYRQGDSKPQSTEKTTCLQFKIFNIPIENTENSLVELNSFLKDVDVKRVFANTINANFWSILIGYTAIVSVQRNEKDGKLLCDSLSELTDSEKAMYEHLKQWRNDKAKFLNLPEYMIFSNKSLMSIAKFRPKTPGELLKIYGIGEKKSMDFGEEIIKICNE
jgi:hypothetical protein